eukprot:s3902_g1.t1
MLPTLGRGHFEVSRVGLQIVYSSSQHVIKKSRSQAVAQRSHSMMSMKFVKAPSCAPSLAILCVVSILSLSSGLLFWARAKPVNVSAFSFRATALGLKPENLSASSLQMTAPGLKLESLSASYLSASSLQMTAPGLQSQAWGSSAAMVIIPVDSDEELAIQAPDDEGVADPNIAHRKHHTFYIIEEGETEDGEQGFWVVDEETGEEGFTGLYTDTECWALGAEGSYSKRRLTGQTFKKGRPEGFGKKGKRSRPGFRPRREKMKQKALAREAAKALAKRDEAAATPAATTVAADAATPAATAASAAAPRAPLRASSSTESSSSSRRNPPTPPPQSQDPLTKGQQLWIQCQNQSLKAPGSSNSNIRVAADWHNVMETNGVVSVKSIAAVQGLLDNG